MTRPDVEDVAKALYFANRGKAPMAWEQLKDNAILVQGRRDYWRQMVQAVYNAMDEVEPAPTLLGYCGVYEVYEYAARGMKWKSNQVFYARCPICQHTFTHGHEDGADQLLLAHFTTTPVDREVAR